MFENKKTISILRIILVIWLVFSFLYIARNEYNRLNQYVYNQGLSTGFEKAITDLIKKAETCKSVPVFLGDRTEQFVNLKCLQNSTLPSDSADGPSTESISESAAPKDQN